MVWDWAPALSRLRSFYMQQINNGIPVLHLSCLLPGWVRIARSTASPLRPKMKKFELSLLNKTLFFWRQVSMHFSFRGFFGFEFMAPSVSSWFSSTFIEFGLYEPRFVGSSDTALKGLKHGLIGGKRRKNQWFFGIHRLRFLVEIIKVTIFKCGDVMTCWSTIRSIFVVLLWAHPTLTEHYLWELYDPQKFPLMCRIFMPE